MNILVINYRDIDHPLAGGAEVHLHRIFGEIAKDENHNVHLLTTSFEGGAAEVEIDGINVHRRGSDKSFNLLALLYLRGLVKKHQIDIVVEDLNKIPIYAPLLYRGPLLVQMHHLWGKSIFDEASKLAASIVWLMEKSIPYFYKRKKFAVVSPSTKSELNQLGIPLDNISTIYNGLEEGFAPKKIKTDKPYFLWLGRLRKYKGIMIALEAFRDFSEIYPGYVLKVAGSGPYLFDIKRWLVQNSLENRVELCGFVSDEQKLELLQGAEALIQSSYKEGWGLTVIEANACAVPAIASNVAGLRDSIIDEETGMLYPVANVNELKNCLLKVSEDKDLRENLSKNALKHANSFSWSKSAKQTLELLTDIVEEADQSQQLDL